MVFVRFWRAQIWGRQLPPDPVAMRLISSFIFILHYFDYTEAVSVTASYTYKYPKKMHQCMRCSLCYQLEFARVKPKLHYFNSLKVKEVYSR